MSYAPVTPRSSCNITFQRAFHVLWYPKHRRRVLGGCIEERLKEIVREEFGHLKSRLPTLWTNSYFVATVGGAPLEAIKQYVENQKSR